jgi:tRNA threonylcarbamoyladenosine modification (KEOPS) complex Cgi121 subunit
MNRVQELRTLVAEFEVDYVKFTEKGNKTAATRARKILQDIRNLSKDIRIEIMDSKKDM